MTIVDSHSRDHDLAFVFSSQGGQWLRMGCRLYDLEPVFQKSIQSCSLEIERYLDWSLQAEFIANQENYRLHEDPARIQPVLTAVQIALSALLDSHGMHPSAVAGLSMGEVAAAHVAGILTLADAFKIVCCQARLTRREQRRGSMAFVNLDLERARGFIQGKDETVAIAVELDPEVSVLSGEANAIENIVADMQRHNVHCGMVPVGFAFHSPEVRILEEEFVATVEGIKPNPGHIRMYSAVVGNVKEGREFGVQHWWKIMSGPASFASLVRSLLRDGYRTFVEIGPHPLLADSIQKTARSVGLDVSTFASMYRNHDDHAVFTETIQSLGAMQNKPESNNGYLT